MLSSYLRLLCTLLFCAGTAPGLRAADHALSEVRRILFLGDSITYSGELVDHFEAFLLTRFPDRKFEVINVGLPGETVAGLSEPGHGNGRFPRPALHERLDRVLAKTQPELVFACYGMNDGLYQPLNEAHFARFRDGVRLLRKKVTRSGTRIVHLTPPPFDPGPRPNGPSYDKTLEAYSQWLVAQRQHGWQVIDFHGAMNRELTARRRIEPRFRFARDGVHPGAEGHWILARELRRFFDQGKSPLESPDDRRYARLLKLIRSRGRILCHAWLDATGHCRPGMKKGAPLAEAKQKAERMEPRIRELSLPLIAP